VVSATWVLVMPVLPFQGPTHATCAACGTRWQVGDLPLMGDRSTNRSELKRRLPGYVATDEIVRPLVRHGENAGCTRHGESGSADCTIAPDKETPLWALDLSPIYYWSADQYDEHEAWYVPYTGGHSSGGSISSQPKSRGNPRHGYRCVREP